MNARLIAVTKPIIELENSGTEGLVAYCARVSNPANQDADPNKLLSYCKEHGHWSVFEMANAVVEVEAPRDITRQMLRHRSFSFQEFSQRYSDQIEFTERQFRRQDTKDRQNSIDDLSSDVLNRAEVGAYVASNTAGNVYEEMLKKGVAKECARVVLPEGLTMSRMYVNGTLRSWMHYLDVRLGNGTQREHVQLAEKIKEVLSPVMEDM